MRIVEKVSNFDNISGFATHPASLPVAEYPFTAMTLKVPSFIATNVRKQNYPKPKF